MSRIKNSPSSIQSIEQDSIELKETRQNYINSLIHNSASTIELGETPIDLLKSTRYLLTDYLDELAVVGIENLQARRLNQERLEKSKEFLEFVLSNQGGNLIFDTSSQIREYISDLLAVNDQKYAQRMEAKRLIEQLLSGEQEVNVNGLLVKNLSNENRQILLDDAWSVYLSSEE